MSNKVFDYDIVHMLLDETREDEYVRTSKGMNEELLDRGYDNGLIDDDDYDALTDMNDDIDSVDDVKAFYSEVVSRGYDAFIADLDMYDGPDGSGPDGTPDDTPEGPDDTPYDPDDTDPTDPDDPDDPDDDTDDPDDGDDELDYDINIVTGDLSAKNPWNEVRRNGLVQGLRNTYMQNDVPYAVTIEGEDADELYNELIDDDSDYELSVKGGQGSPSEHDEDVYFDSLGNLLGGDTSSDVQYENTLDSFDVTEVGDKYVLHGFDNLTLDSRDEYTYWVDVEHGDDVEKRSDEISPEPETRSVQEDMEHFEKAWNDGMYFNPDEDQTPYREDLFGALKDDLRSLMNIGQTAGNQLRRTRARMG